MQLDPFAGPIYTIILIVDRLFFLFLEWWMPREDIDLVRSHWEQKGFVGVFLYFLMSGLSYSLAFL
jgi:phosphatidylinositol N-acetylglucosaminyltransferase subunit A